MIGSKIEQKREELVLIKCIALTHKIYSNVISQIAENLPYPLRMLQAYLPCMHYCIKKVVTYSGVVTDSLVSDSKL